VAESQDTKQKSEPFTVTNKFDRQNAPSAKNLQQVFETAVCEIHQLETSAQRVRYRTPIVQRVQVAPVSRADAEKRAVSDAARALSQLWKVSASHAR
jgi:hypothetical protein